MNNKSTKLILFAAVILAAGSTAFAGGPRHHKPDGIDTAARIVDLVLQVVRPAETVIVTPAPVVYSTPVVYPAPVATQTIVTRKVYTTPNVVYTHTIYNAPPARQPRYHQPVPHRGGKPGPGNNHRPNHGPGPRR